MIDLKFAYDEFENYLKSYDVNDPNILLKVRHTYGVVRCSKYITEAINLDEENVKLAMLIALLHDIGRFEQIKMTESFSDNKGFDHAYYGAQMLFESNRIRDYIKSSKYDDIIYKAIINHNKYKIQDGLKEAELLHANIIRDADKLDNFRVKETENFENMFCVKYNPDTIEFDTISPKVYDDFMDCKLILTNDIKTQIDNWISYIAFIFDLQFDISLKYIKDNNYIDILVNRIDYKNSDTKRMMGNIRNLANSFINKN